MRTLKAAFVMFPAKVPIRRSLRACPRPSTDGKRAGASSKTGRKSWRYSRRASARRSLWKTVSNGSPCFWSSRSFSIAAGMRTWIASPPVRRRLEVEGEGRKRTGALRQRDADGKDEAVAVGLRGIEPAHGARARLVHELESEIVDAARPDHLRSRLRRCSDEVGAFAPVTGDIGARGGDRVRFDDGEPGINPRKVVGGCPEAHRLSLLRAVGQKCAVAIQHQAVRHGRQAGGSGVLCPPAQGRGDGLGIVGAPGGEAGDALRSA